MVEMSRSTLSASMIWSPLTESPNPPLVSPLPQDTFQHAHIFRTCNTPSGTAYNGCPPACLPLLHLLACVRERGSLAPRAATSHGRNRHQSLERHGHAKLRCSACFDSPPHSFLSITPRTFSLPLLDTQVGHSYSAFAMCQHAAATQSTAPLRDDMTHPQVGVAESDLNTSDDSGTHTPSSDTFALVVS
jgi:hypothetical protein